MIKVTEKGVIEPETKKIENIFIIFVRVRAALLKIKSTTYKLFSAIFLTTVLL